MMKKCSNNSVWNGCFYEACKHEASSSGDLCPACYNVEIRRLEGKRAELMTEIRQVDDRLWQLGR